MNIFSADFEKRLEQLIEKKLEEVLSKRTSETKKSKGTSYSTLEGYFTKKQACAFLNISLSNLNNHLDSGLIKRRIIKGRILIKKTDLEDLLSA